MKSKRNRKITIPDYLLAHPEKREYRIQLTGIGTYYASFKSLKGAIMSAKRKAKEHARLTGENIPAVIVTPAGEWHST